MKSSKILISLLLVALIGCRGDGGKSNLARIEVVPAATATDSWKPYPQCGGGEGRGYSDTPELRLSSCQTGEMFHVDGPELLRLTTEYVCSPSELRSSFTFRVAPPSLASALNSIATSKLQRGGTAGQEREFVQSVVNSYAESVQAGSEMYPSLLRHVVAALEKEGDAELSTHIPSEAVRRSLTIPSGCQHQGSELRTRAVVAIANESVQRFSQLHWRRLTDMVARANKVADVEAANLAIPPFVLSFTAADSISRVYGATAPGNGGYPDGFVDIDITMSDSGYSRFAVPVAVVPPAALSFLEKQGAAIHHQMGEVVDRIEKSGAGGEVAIYVPSPDSARVFPNRFWAEHILWQVAFREVLLDEGVSLDPNDFETYGLH